MIKSYRYQEGFTLLELMVVICILGVLAVVAVPRFEGAIAQANSVKIQMDMETIDTAAIMYQSQHGTSPADVASLEDYIEDVDDVKPPKGKCFINGTLSDVPAESYSLQADEGSTVKKAHCGNYGRRDFGTEKS